MPFFNFFVRHRTQAALRRRAISDTLWHSTLQALPFVQHQLRAHTDDAQRLRVLCSLFLDHKEFSGANGWQVTDAQAVLVALQACVPLLHIAPASQPAQALQWYSSFVGIVLHAGQVRARRSHLDDAGVLHHWQETITGEAMQGGPLMLAYSDVVGAGEAAAQISNDAADSGTATDSAPYNVVIHEFAHVMDMRSGVADGCPPMPAPVQQVWRTTLHGAYQQFCEHHAQWLRFGALATTQPLLDGYATESPEEFFAVAAEAYFVRRADFAVAYPDLLTLFDKFFRAYFLL